MLAPRYVLDSLPYALSIPDPVTESYIVVALHIVRKWLRDHSYKGPFILLFQIISVEYPTNFEIGVTFSIVPYALNWF